MGHYYADMACQKCGNLRCTCPAKPHKPEKGWIVDDDFMVLSLADFDAKKLKSQSKRFQPLSPLFYRLGHTIYKSRRAAEKGAMKECERRVEETRAQLLHLKNVLKVQRPWEKK